jgi:hypothetical protein
MVLIISRTPGLAKCFGRGSIPQAAGKKVIVSSPMDAPFAVS